MGDLPIARTPEQEFLAAVCQRLDRQNDLLADLRDRLPAPMGGQPVPDDRPPPDEPVTEPDPPAAPENTVLLVEPSAPEAPKSAPEARKQPARKPQAKKTTTTPRTRGRAAAPKGKES